MISLISLQGGFRTGTMSELQTLSLIVCCWNVSSQKYTKKWLFTASVREVNGKKKLIDVTEIPTFSAHHNFEFGPRGIRVRKAYSVGKTESKTVNYITNIVRKLQGPNSIAVRYSKIFWIFLLRNFWRANNQWHCLKLQHHLSYGQRENKTSQESVYNQLLRDWVARFTTPIPENHPGASLDQAYHQWPLPPFLWDGRFKGQELVEQGAPLMWRNI